jgi:hypothetical protein
VVGNTGPTVGDGDEWEDVDPRLAYSPAPIPSRIKLSAARNQTIFALRMKFVSLKEVVLYVVKRATLDNRIDGAAKKSALR